MRIWLEISPWTWNIWPLIGTYAYGEPYPAELKHASFVDVGPLRLVWSRKGAA